MVLLTTPPWHHKQPEPQHLLNEKPVATGRHMSDGADMGAIFTW